MSGKNDQTTSAQHLRRVWPELGGADGAQDGQRDGHRGVQRDGPRDRLRDGQRAGAGGDQRGDVDGVVRVVLREDHQIYLTGLRTLLDSEPGFSVAELDSLVTACTWTDVEIASVVLVVRQGLLHGAELDALTQLTARNAAVLVLAESDSEPELRQALRSGVRGYLSRRLTGWQLVNAVRALAQDEPAFDMIMARHLMRYLAEEPAGPEANGPTTLLDQFTERQRAVALLVADGLTNDEIARRLHVGQTTVKTHLATVMRRLDVRSRTQLAVLVNRVQRT